MRVSLLRSFLFCILVSEDASAKSFAIGPHDTTSMAATVNSRISLKLTSRSSSDVSFMQVRGGALSKKRTSKEAAAAKAKTDLNLAMIKVFVGSIVESALMHQVLLFSSSLAKDIKDNTFATVVQFLMIGSVVFGSSTYGSIIDNGLSAATQQIAAPTEIPGDPNWYQNLKKPSWNPPGWVFPIMWLIISKPTQFVALWKLKNIKAVDFALLVYSIHLSFGDAWNKVFFGLQQVKAGLVVISTFWTLLVTSAYLFYTIDPTAGLFLVPTCLWVTVAASLNWSIYWKNK